MRIQHNIMAMNSYRNYTGNNSALSKNLEKLSSGYKINRAGDDAAGLAISEKMRAQITGLETAQSNAQSGINLVQTAEGALTEVHDMLNRMVELADQSANGTYDNDTDRANLQKEFNQLRTEIDRIADASNFNGQKLLDGTLSVKYTAASVDSVKDSITADTKTVKAGTTTYVKTADDTYYTADSLSAVKAQIADAANGAKVTDTSDSDKVWTYTSATKTWGDGATTKTSAEMQALVAAGDKFQPAGGTEVTVAADVAANKKDLAGVKALVVKDATVSIDGASDITVTENTNDTDANGNELKGLTLQIGDTSNDYNQITLDVGSVKAASLGISTLDISDQTTAATAVDTLKTAINTVSGIRGDLGATQNRLEHTINNLSVMTENIQDAESNIRDVDVAAEMMQYTKNNILVQSAQAMLAQANQAPQGVLQLLQ